MAAGFPMPVPANDNWPETPQQFRQRQWLAEHRPANDNLSGKAAHQWPLMARAKAGKLCPGAAEAIGWFETVLEDAAADASVLPSGLFLTQDDIDAAGSDGDHEYGGAVEIGDVDMEPTYGPTPEWIATRADSLVFHRGRGVDKEPGRGKILAIGLLVEKSDGSRYTYWQSALEDTDRIKGARRPEVVPAKDGRMKGEDDPEITWTRQMHRTGQRGAPLVKTPPALYRAYATKHIERLKGRLGEEALVVLIRAVLKRETSIQIGTAPGVTHDRARVRGNQMIGHAIDGLVDYWFEVRGLDKLAA